MSFPDNNQTLTLTHELVWSEASGCEVLLCVESISYNPDRDCELLHRFINGGVDWKLGKKFVLCWIIWKNGLKSLSHFNRNHVPEQQKIRMMACQSKAACPWWNCVEPWPHNWELFWNGQQSHGNCYQPVWWTSCAAWLLNFILVKVDDVNQFFHLPLIEVFLSNLNWMNRLRSWIFKGSHLQCLDWLFLAFAWCTCW